MSKARSIVVTLRVPPEPDRRIDREARRLKRTKRALVRDALVRAFALVPELDDPAREARRQSLLVSGRQSEREVLAFIDAGADEQGWQ